MVRDQTELEKALHETQLALGQVTRLLQRKSNKNIMLLTESEEKILNNAKNILRKHSDIEDCLRLVQSNGKTT